MQDIKNIQKVLKSLHMDTGTETMIKPGFSGPILANKEYEYQQRIYKVICRDLVYKKTYENLLYNICILGCVYDSRVHKNVGKILNDDLAVCKKCDLKVFQEDIKDEMCYVCMNNKD